MHDPDCPCSYELYLGISKPYAPLGRLWVLVLVDAATRKAIWYWSKPDPEDSEPSGSSIWPLPWSKPNPDANVNYIRTRSKRLVFRRSEFADTLLLGTIQAEDYGTFQDIFYELDLTWNKKFVAMFVANLARLGLIENGVARDVLMASWVGGYQWRFLDVKVPADDEAGSNLEDEGGFLRDGVG
ncbi:uncharacterized protein DSM5745_08527 [Aspergillus mulundensis]|uniref:Uncharacterized protein n=1 Tax=Aspergillus mulundensis TaxID=1810919 RepID=A0A3D8R451_9EURO|nr:hypothetical protein DSM5745_08527 [Aspergillus mulundensis]RDW68767.1 hypothetical protein DSM5745_08527 [Aspergillus mulundensis]